MSLRRLCAVIVGGALAGASTIGLGTAPVDAASAPPNIAAAPTQLAHTALGAVGYREVGHGPTLLLITGFGASMDDWAPSFIDDLAAHFRVVVFDNAGIGQTVALPVPLSVSEMAAQTSALISTLRLGRGDVLGWSMGGLIAQSLAVTHPGQVKRLVLAATQPGTGKATPVPSTVQTALDRGNPAAVLSVLFPPDQTVATKRYVAGILSYPGYYTASATVRADQQVAIDQWVAGGDASGRRPSEIRRPTLVADGTDDVVNALSNDRLLVALIHGAHLVLYPGAGHGFLFQDASRFVSELRSFLG